MTDLKTVREAFEKEWPNWDKYPSGNYIDEIVDRHWQTWQAAWNTRTALQAAPTDAEKALEAAKELIAIFMEFKFLREDWKVKAAVEKYYAVIGERVPM